GEGGGAYAGVVDSASVKLTEYCCGALWPALTALTEASLFLLPPVEVAAEAVLLEDSPSPFFVGPSNLLSLMPRSTCFLAIIISENPSLWSLEMRFSLIWPKRQCQR
ncbi:hypothetical protein CRG98_049572, partial [Punica granatum]